MPASHASQAASRVGRTTPRNNVGTLPSAHGNGSNNHVREVMVLHNAAVLLDGGNTVRLVQRPCALDDSV